MRRTEKNGGYAQAQHIDMDFYDRFYGYGRDDFINGRGGSDYIDGGSGNDYIEGEGGSYPEGKDTLVGGSGYDECYGNGGTDRFSTSCEVAEQ